MKGVIELKERHYIADVGDISRNRYIDGIRLTKFGFAAIGRGRVIVKFQRKRSDEKVFKKDETKSCEIVVK